MPHSNPTPDDDPDSADQSQPGRPDTCPECGGDVVRYTETEEYICDVCGLVIEQDWLDRGPDWRAYSSDEQRQKKRVGPPLEELQHDHGLSTEIDSRNQDAYGRALSTKQRQRLNRLRTWHSRAQTENSTDRNIRAGLTEIRRMASALDVPRTTTRIAGRLYRQAAERDMLPGRSVEGMASAALYTATRQTKYPRTVDEVAAVSRVEKQEIARAYRYLADELDLEVQPSQPQQYVPRFITELGLSTDTERTAQQILEETPHTLTSGKNPAGVAAAAVYIASIQNDEKVTQAELRDISHVTKVTIRNRYQDIVENTDISLD